ncbi:SDR family NAD(P)-dependent oxidoreductase [Pseudoalteromonas sp. JBTF-M23]|uniref:SDR family NAD(P)-dependent oxidoreductase n=1 Tax=Pseudoalteromonas caenipelagi TaxID=2726988 RepID=A0A849VJR0_9GAMM|nr:SDR family NAD(P)-dependent oxidoreductase [Pseudoalteromonas caenipelagi]NOU51951.1 SDR family NAD(P)-dependent oxidoreductase [Pseudoalteromonas caenipelagi]
MSKKVALVTGANRGIGLEICRQLIARDIHVVMACRNLEKVQKAQSKLAAQLPNALAKTSLVQLDMTCDEDFQTLEKTWCQEGIDILVNNAGISRAVTDTVVTESEENARLTLETNFWGAWRLSRMCIDAMKAKGYGRIVNISSGHGTYAKLDRYNPGYRISKLALNGLTKMFDDEVKDYEDILVNAMTPGWVRTHLGGLRAERSVEEGAETAVWLCMTNDKQIRGKLYKDRGVFPW